MLSGTPAIEQDRAARLTTEMTKAIKRQEPNSGLDYWRPPGLNTIGFVATERRPTYKKVTQINLNFPGAVLPNLSTGPQYKLNKREHPASAVVLSRSRTSLVPKVSSNSRSPGNSNISVIPSSKKGLVTDLTCLQLADTLFTSKKSPYAGLLNFWPGRARYTDYFMDKKESNNEENDFDILSDTLTSKEKQKSNNIHRRGINIPVSHYKTLPAEEEALHNNRESYSHGAITISPVSSCGEVTGSIEDKNHLKPQKSILKNASQKQYLSKNNTKRENPPEHTEQFASVNNCSYQLPTVECEKLGYGHTDKIVTLDKISPTIKYSVSRPGSNKKYYQPSPNKEYALDGLMKDMSIRKRAVRFNSTHEVREYAPCEPISYC